MSWGRMSSSEDRRSLLLIGGSVAAALVLVLSYLAAGGASYTPAQIQDPCEDRPWRDPEGLQQIAEQFSFSALDGAACELGVTRETLARALATSRSRELFLERYEIEDAELARAIRAGLLRAVDDAEAAGVLSPLLAGPLRGTLRQIPLDQAIELLRDGRSLLDDLQTLLGPGQEFLGPAQDLLEQFLP